MCDRAEFRRHLPQQLLQEWHLASSPASRRMPEAGRSGGGANHVFTVDLEAQIVTGPDGEVYAFEVDAGRKANLMEGLDEIGSSMTAAGEIDTFEARRRVSMPWLEKAS